MINVFLNEVLSASNGRWYSLNDREKQRVVMTVLNARGDRLSTMQSSQMARGNPNFQFFRVISTKRQT